MQGNEKKGAEFMSLRFNVRQKRKEIRKELTILQNFLLDDIAEGTINEWASQQEFSLKGLAKDLGVRVNKIYVALKDLHQRGLIIRKPSDRIGCEIIGLNPQIFGQILTDHQHSIEKRKHLKLVDNSGIQPANSVQKKDPDSPSLGSDQSPIRTSLVPNWDQISSQHTEIIEEKTPLDSYRCLIDVLDAKDLNGQLRKTEEEWTDPRKVREYCGQIFSKMGMVR